MATVGYAAMFEQFTPSDLLAYCRQAERAGFTSVMASDHFHPWTPGQGQSGFVWSWLGALGATTGLRFGTGVTPPGPRYHPAIIAQAAATLEQMFPGRFWLGLGAGEALGARLASLHNLRFLVRLMERARDAILDESSSPPLRSPPTDYRLPTTDYRPEATGFRRRRSAFRA